MVQKLADLEQDRSMVVTDFKKQIQDLETKNLEIQKNFEKSQRQNQDMEKIKQEYDRLKKSL